MTRPAGAAVVALVQRSSIGRCHPTDDGVSQVKSSRCRSFGSLDKCIEALFCLSSSFSTFHV